MHCKAPRWAAFPRAFPTVRAPGPLTWLVGLSLIAVAAQAAGAISLSAATVDRPLLVFSTDAQTSGTEMRDGLRLGMAVEDGFRVYRVTRRGRTHMMRVALDERPRHVAFDPQSARFEVLSPSLRVELRDYGQLPQVVEAAGGTGGKVYDLLGFALIHLPVEVNPAQAAAAIADLSAVISARVKVRGPRPVLR